MVASVVHNSPLHEIELNGHLGSRPGQSAFLDDKACDSLDTFAALQIGKNERPLDTHSQSVRFHYLKICAYEGSQIYLVDDEKIGAHNPGAALPWNFLAFRYIDHVNGQVGEFGAEGCRKVIATRLDEAQFGVRKLPV